MGTLFGGGVYSSQYSNGACLTLGDLGSYELFITWGGVDSTPSKIAKNAPMGLKIGRMV